MSVLYEPKRNASNISCTPKTLFKERNAQKSSKSLAYKTLFFTTVFTIPFKIKHPVYNIRRYVMNEFLTAYQSCATKYFLKKLL